MSSLMAARSTGERYQLILIGSFTGRGSGKEAEDYEQGRPVVHRRAGVNGMR